jgi:flagellar export protein FliJ
MRPLRFRAQAALDLRQREYDAARRVLARAETDLRAARHLLAERRQALEDGRTQCGNAQAVAGPATQLQWYRFWIVRLEQEHTSQAAVVTAREREVAAATAACLRAKQRLESIERFKEKASAAWERMALAEEQKELDTLATLRFVAQQRAADPGR